ncbi:MAG: guanylate kinase [Chlamydiales bacterium]|nr:guanylate kinase [Chlamydiales bacterium]
MLNNEPKVLGNLEKGLVFVISAPAGTGKTTLVSKLTAEFACVKASVSYTTRKPRNNEIEGVHYHFVSPEIFDEKVYKNEFLEHAKVFDHYYGTCKKSLEMLLLSGHHAILVIDTQGALNISQVYPEAITIFISPPSFNELKKRLSSRSTENPASTEQRLSWAKHEEKKSSFYNYHIINNDLNVAYAVLKSILIAEEHKAIHINAPF